MDTCVTDESRFFRINGSEFTSPVRLEGWSRRSIWGFEDGRYFLTLWRDGALMYAEPDFWRSLAARPPLVTAGAVALSIVSFTQSDPVTASAALQILAPSPAVDPASRITTIAANELHALDTESSGDFTRGAATTYLWALGRSPQTPASFHCYQTFVPDYRQIAAEWNIVQGLLSGLCPEDSHAYFAGVDLALRTLVCGML